MGYCYYGNYAQFLEVGRVEALRAVGMSYKSLEEQGILLPVSDFSINYISPAFYDDNLTIQTTITEITGARILFNYMVENDKNKLICTAETTLVFVDKSSGRPIKAPERLLQLLSNYVVE